MPLAARCLLMATLATSGPATAITCVASATTTAFGVYTPTSGSAADTTGSVTVTCDPVLAALFFNFTVQLSAGSGGSFSPRRMFSGGSSLNYQLYRNAARSEIWGSGSGGTFNQLGGIWLSVVFPVSQVFTVYGRMPAGQTAAAPGAYTDSITVTVIY